MKKKNIYYITLLICLSIIVLFISVYTFKNTNLAGVPQKIQSNDTTPSLRWDLHISEIKKSIGAYFMGVKVSRIKAGSIYSTADITRDNIPEAFVVLDNKEPKPKRFALIHLDKHGYIQPASFQYKTGAIGDVLFLEESNALDGMHTILSSSTQSIISMHWNIDAFDSSKLECEFETYTWNASTSLFVFNAQESYFAKTPLCESMLKNR
ncbi:MAG: hypothetical protein RIQ72_678 [Candidatus Parcubacteria bacterium]|jgi:hypothetical protein